MTDPVDCRFVFADPVMGGKSHSSFSSTDDHGTFSGTCAIVPSLKAPTSAAPRRLACLELELLVETGATFAIGRGGGDGVTSSSRRLRFRSLAARLGSLSTSGSRKSGERRLRAMRCRPAWP